MSKKSSKEIRVLTLPSEARYLINLVGSHESTATALSVYFNFSCLVLEMNRQIRSRGTERVYGSINTKFGTVSPIKFSRPLYTSPILNSTEINYVISQEKVSEQVKAFETELKQYLILSSEDDLKRAVKQFLVMYEWLVKAKGTMEIPIHCGVILDREITLKEYPRS